MKALRCSWSAARSAARSITWLIKTTYENWIEDNGPRLAAALAYYALFSLAPLLMIASAVAGAVLGQRPAQTALVAQFYGFVGPAGARAIESVLEDLHRPGRSSLIGTVGSVLSLIGASAVFVELEDALNTIWHTAKMSLSFRAIVAERLLGLVLVLATEILIIVSVFFATVQAALGRIAAAEGTVFELPFRFVGLAVSFAVIAFLLAVIFKFLPKTPIKWCDVWPAALVTAVMFDVGKFLIAFYLGRSGIISAYGAASSVVIVVGWIYYSALILYFGAEFAKVYARTYGSQTRLPMAQ